jgi:hypothetical protein
MMRWGSQNLFFYSVWLRADSICHKEVRAIYQPRTLVLFLQCAQAISMLRWGIQRLSFIVCGCGLTPRRRHKEVRAMYQPRTLILFLQCASYLHAAMRNSALIFYILCGCGLTPCRRHKEVRAIYQPQALQLYFLSDWRGHAFHYQIIFMWLLLIWPLWRVSAVKYLTWLLKPTFNLGSHLFFLWYWTLYFFLSVSFYKPIPFSYATILSFFRFLSSNLFLNSDYFYLHS